VNQSSQTGNPLNTASIDGIVHSRVCRVLCPDIPETESLLVFQVAAFWLMGGGTPTPQASTRQTSLSPATQVESNDRGVASRPPPDLTGYTQIPASNVSFSPAAGSALTINSSTNITATSSTKTITEVLLFQAVSDPTDTILLDSTQSPFSISFTPMRIESTTVTAFALFSHMTYPTTALSYTLHPLSDPLH